MIKLIKTKGKVDIKMNIYDFKVMNNKHEEVELSQYKGKVMLIVNTATKCGLTPQYKELEELYKEFHEQGLEILDFPCNQFLEQAPGDDKEINEFCQLNYGTTFARFAKIDVNGKDTHPLYQFLKKEVSVDKEDENAAPFNEKVKGLTAFHQAGDIKWNFGKFLVDRKGEEILRFSPVYDTNDLKKDIKRLLEK
jgi:glutathione peroxidase